MGFQNAVRKCFKDFATFQGRAPRSEFWWFMLFIFLGQLACSVLDRMIFGTGTFVTGTGFAYYATNGGPIGTIFTLICLLPWLVRHGLRQSLMTNQLRLHLLRVALAVIGIQFWLWALAVPVPIW